MGGLIQASNGDLYGTTSLGGNNAVGTLFKIRPSGTLTTLYNFPNGEDNPFGLVQASNGKLYGGVDQDVVEFTPPTPTVLYSFVSGFTTGSLIQANDGNFYGTTTDTVFERLLRERQPRFTPVICLLAPMGTTRSPESFKPLMEIFMAQRRRAEQRAQALRMVVAPSSNSAQAARCLRCTFSSLAMVTVLGPV